LAGETVKGGRDFRVSTALKFVSTAVAGQLLFPVAELLVEFRVTAVEGNLPAVDEEVADARAGFEYVAVGDDEVGDLARVD
jgi:hypothetical protein